MKAIWVLNKITNFLVNNYLIIIFLIILFFPKVKSLNHTYQECLWTSTTTKNHNEQTSDIRFKLGGEIEILKPWTRINLGFPISCITLDYQSEFKILQVRIETVNWIKIFCLASIALLLLKIGKRFKTKKDRIE
jgi:hypothetical protein